MVTKKNRARIFEDLSDPWSQGSAWLERIRIWENPIAFLVWELLWFFWWFFLDLWKPCSKKIRKKNNGICVSEQFRVSKHWDLLCQHCLLTPPVLLFAHGIPRYFLSPWHDRFDRLRAPTPRQLRYQDLWGLATRAGVQETRLKNVSLEDVFSGMRSVPKDDWLRILVLYREVNPWMWTTDITYIYILLMNQRIDTSW